jgi:hypothetical protein
MLLKAIAKGIPLKAACKLAGLGFTAFSDWRDKDAGFAQRVELAEAVAIERNLALIQKAAAKNWKAAAWLLERRHPEMFARPEVQLALAQQITKANETSNLGVWFQQIHTPSKNGNDPFDIQNLEIICDAETEPTQHTESDRVDIENLDLFCDAKTESINVEKSPLSTKNGHDERQPVNAPNWIWRPRR